MNIVLIGYRGSGKSSIGKVVAARLGYAFIDTDALIIRDAGKTIREIFAEETERGFREREARAVATAAAQDRCVIAAGGGVVLRQENTLALRQRGRLVWLRADPAVLFARIHADHATRDTRPSLTAGGGLDEVRQLLAAREPLYAAAAHAQLDVGTLSVEQAAERVIALTGAAA